MLSVMDASATHDQRNSFSFRLSKQNFVDTSTWEQIIRILEESSIQALESANPDWLGRNFSHQYRINERYGKDYQLSNFTNRRESQMKDRIAVKNIVLVHGGFVDGSGWEGVYKILKRDGYTVAIVQNPTISLADDVAVTRRTIANQDGPVILVGHSYGGAVITEAGNDPKVAGLVYVAAFALDKGESVSSLIKDPPPSAPVPPILPPQDGYLFLDNAKFPASFAADVEPGTAAFMADSQVPWGLDALNGTISEPAWNTKPSWYLLTTEDKMIPPDAQRAMSKRAGATVVEIEGSHAIYVSQPQAVAALIETAAKGEAAKAA